MVKSSKNRIPRVIKGHALLGEGAPYSKWSKERILPKIKNGSNRTYAKGYALCECGALSETVLPSERARQRWHQKHKSEIVKHFKLKNS